MIHVYSSYVSHDPEVNRRMALAKQSWQQVPWQNMPIENKDLDRVWNEVVNNQIRQYPYIKDILDLAASQCQPNEILVYTNSDIVVRPDCVAVISAWLQHLEAAYGYRRDFERLDAIPPDFTKGKAYAGSDIYAMRVRWWTSNRNKMPDMIAGFEAWDPCMRIIIEESHAGNQVSIPDLIAHERHGGENHWEHDRNRYHLKGQQLCLRHAAQFFRHRGLNPKQFGIPEWYLAQSRL